MKKFLAMLLAFVMLFSLTMPAMAEEETQTIYFENTENWESVNAYYWIDGNSVGINPWPGTAMTNVGGNIWSIEVPTSADNIIFNNGSGTQTDNITIPTDGKNLYNYDTGTWSTYGSTGGSTVTGGTEGDVIANYNPTIKITGVSITVDGTTYTEGNVTIKPDSTVTLTVTGTNLQHGTEDNCVLYTSGGSIAINSGWFKFSEDGTTATSDIPASDFSNSSNFEIVYYNNYTAADRTQNYTGICVTYDSGIAEEDKAVITSVSITVDGTTYTEGNVTIKPDSNVTLTVTGTNLQNGTMDNWVDYAAGIGAPLKSDFFKCSDDGTTATMTCPASEFSNSSNFEIVYYNNYTVVADRTENSTGIYVTYNDGTTPVYNITVKALNGTVTTDKANVAAGETVTVTVEANMGYVYVVGSLKVTNDTTNEEVEVNEDTKTFVMPASSVTVTAEFEKLTTTSAEITWGSLSFTYDDTIAEGATEETGWTCAEGTNTITVENTGETTFTAQPTYTAETGYSEINGRFYDSEDAEQGNTMGVSLNKEQSHTFWLRLLGKPEKAIPAGTKIGTVTIEIVEGSPE